MRRTAIPVFLIAGSCLTTLLVFEFFLRVVYPQPVYDFEQGLFQASDRYGYTLTPGMHGKHTQPEYVYGIDANSFGFRGPEPDFDAQHRVLVLGDSNAMGQGVREDRHMIALARTHYARLGADIDIFNTAISGYSGWNQEPILDDFLASYRPNHVVLVFSWNDIDAGGSLRVDDGYLVLMAGETASLARARRWLGLHSHLYTLVKRRYYAFNSVRTAGGATTASADTSTDIGALDRVVDRLTSMRDRTVQGGGHFTVILFPVDLDDPGAFETEREYLNDQLTERRVEFQDWTPPIILEPEGLRFPVDRHFNSDGHARLAGLLIPLIDKQYR